MSAVAYSLLGAAKAIPSAGRIEEFLHEVGSALWVFKPEEVPRRPPDEARRRDPSGELLAVRHVHQSVGVSVYNEGGGWTLRSS